MYIVREPAVYSPDTQDSFTVIVGTAVDGDIVTLEVTLCASESMEILRGNADRLLLCMVAFCELNSEPIMCTLEC